MLQDNNNPNIQEPEMASPDFKMYRIIFAVFLGICWLALLSFSPADIDQLAGGLEYTGATRNLLGALGARFAWSMLIGGGLASYILLFIATLCCIRRIFFRKVLRASKWEYFLGVPLFALGFCMMLGIFPEAFSGITKALNISTMPGGVLGSLLCAPGSGWLYMLLSATGSGIIAGVIILFSGMIIWSYDWRESTRAAVQYISRRIEENQVRKAQDAYQKECAAANVQEEAAPPVQPDIPPLTMHCDIQADAPSPESGIGFRSRRGEASIAAARAVNEAVGGGHAGNASAPAPRPQYQPSAPPPPPLQQRQPDLPLKQPTVQTPPPPPPPPAPSRPLFSGRSDNSSGYILPSSEFFTPPSETGSLSSSEEIQLNINRIQQTMDNFKLDATVINAIPGPQITLYEIELGPKTLVKKFAELKHNICLELRSQARLLLPIPNKHTVGIEVPNKKRITVTARELFDSDVWRSSRAQIPIMLGKNIKNETMLFDLVSAPHMLVAGTTGSGKSVCMNLMLQSLLMRFSPDELKLIMFDPKVLEFQPYANLPHLLAPIINQPSKMGLVLRWLINEMERRFIMLGDIGGVRKLSEFNSRPKSDTPQYDRYGNEIPDRLPYIVVFIDELADIMLQNAKEVDMALARLAGKARAAGIHMIIATQRPDAKTVNGLIKSNIPWRTALKVAGSVNSRIIIDQIGAETLLGNGDMLFMGDRDLERIQGGWVSNSEIDNVVKFCCSQGGPVFDSSLVMALESQDNEEDEGSSGGFGGGDGGYGGSSAPAGGGGGQSADGDDRIAQALEIIRASKRATISHLQRRMGIGYNKAADLVDELESLGYLGPQPPSGTREIYWDNFPKNDFAAFADADADNAYDDGQDFDSAEDDEPPFA